MRSGFLATVLGVSFAAALAAAAPAHAQDVKVAGLVELSGPSATTGTNFDNGVKLAVKEINAKGGILGKQIAYRSWDTQSQPGVALGLTTRAVDDGAVIVMGPGTSGSALVSMKATREAEIPNFTGAEVQSLTEQGNPYIFRTSLTQASSMPKVVQFMKDNLKVKTVAVMFINNDFGKGGRDIIVDLFGKAGIKVVADISTEPGQIDFSSAVLRIKQSGADALFSYTVEDESARALRELRKQGYDKPIVGESTLASAKVIELAGDAANGIYCHVGLTVDAPDQHIQAFSKAFTAAYGYKSDHNAMKGYTGMYTAKAVFERLGKIDPKAFAAALHGATLKVSDAPGILFDTTYNAKGDLNRESYIVQVKEGKAVVVETLKPASP